MIIPPPLNPAWFPQIDRTAQIPEIASVSISTGDSRFQLTSCFNLSAPLHSALPRKFETSRNSGKTCNHKEIEEMYKNYHPNLIPIHPDRSLHGPYAHKTVVIHSSHIQTILHLLSKSLEGNSH